MTLSAAVEAPDGRVFSRQPQLWLVAAIAAAGCAAPARSVALALTSNDVDLVQAGLLDWITVPYILAGLIAWWRRPESRLGLLMIAGGVASGLSALQLTHVDVLYTIGAAFDILPAALFVDGNFQGPWFQPLQRTTLAVIGLSPIVFLLGLLDARLARSAVGELVIALRADPEAHDLRDALARALHDPSLTLAYWLPDFETYVDLEGRPLALPKNPARASTVLDRDGRQVAALIHDSELVEERELLDAVGAAAGIALENARLQADLRARVEELKGSRTRVIEAGQKERQRLERNLHDGAQQRLIALSLRLSLLEQRLVEQPDARAQLDSARHEIALSLEELRAVARGIHPAVLTAHGLAVALESLAAAASLPVRLTVEIDRRLPEHVEVAAYYVVSESLANVAKHAQATHASVEVAEHANSLVVEVLDDGVGGADTERGSGLRGLADRVEALGGRLKVWTPQGGGTRVQAAIPCA